MILFCGLVLTVEALSYLCGSALERFSASVDLKPKRLIYAEQQEKIRAAFRDDGNDVFDPLVGWAYRPGFRGTLYTNNSDGLRGTKEYVFEPEQGVQRIALFGDSFVYGNEVADHETWAYHLERLMPCAEVLNFGVGGYGNDQALLRYENLGRRFHPDIVVIGFVSVQLRRNVNVYRRFISTSELAHFKPRFTLDEGGDLRLVPLVVGRKEDLWRYHEQPELITRIGGLDDAYRPYVYENPVYDYSTTVRLVAQVTELLGRRLDDRRRLYDGGQFNPESEAFQITSKVLERFATVAEEDGARALVVMFPAFDDVSQPVPRRETAYDPLVERLREASIEVVDLAGAFQEPVTRTRHFMPGGHYSPHSNRVIAEHLAKYLSHEQREQPCNH